MRGVGGEKGRPENDVNSILKYKILKVIKNRKELSS